MKADYHTSENENDSLCHKNIDFPDMVNPLPWLGCKFSSTKSSYIQTHGYQSHDSAYSYAQIHVLSDEVYEIAAY